MPACGAHGGALDDCATHSNITVYEATTQPMCAVGASGGLACCTLDGGGTLQHGHALHANWVGNVHSGDELGAFDDGCMARQLIATDEWGALKCVNDGIAILCIGWR